MESLRNKAFEWLESHPGATRREAALKFGISPSALYRAKAVLVCPSCGRLCDEATLKKFETLGVQPKKKYVDKSTEKVPKSQIQKPTSSVDKTTSAAMRVPDGCVMCGGH